MTWKKHIHYICNTISKGICILVRARQLLYTIEYCIVSENLFNEINLFEVGNHLSDLYDHSKISCHIKRIKYKTEQLHYNNLKLESVPLGYIWHNERFIEALNSNMTEREVTRTIPI